MTARTLETVLPIPAGSTVTLTPPALPDKPQTHAEIRLAAPSTLTTKETRQEATGATTHAPPAPPTPSDYATAAGVRLFYWLAAGLALAAILLFYVGHSKAAVVAAAGAGALPLLATSATWLASHAAVAVVCVAGALVAAWYFVRARIPAQHDGPRA